MEKIIGKKNRVVKAVYVPIIFVFGLIFNVPMLIAIMDNELQGVVLVVCIIATTIGAGMLLFALLYFLLPNCLIRRDGDNLIFVKPYVKIPFVQILSVKIAVNKLNEGNVEVRTKDGQVYTQTNVSEPAAVREKLNEILGDFQLAIGAMHERTQHH